MREKERSKSVEEVWRERRYRENMEKDEIWEEAYLYPDVYISNL